MNSAPAGNQQSFALMGHGEFSGNKSVVARQMFLDAVAAVDKPALVDLDLWAQQIAAESPPKTIPRYVAAVQEWAMSSATALALSDAGLDGQIRSWLRRRHLENDESIAAAVLWTLGRWVDALLNKKPRSKPPIVVAPQMDDGGTLYARDFTSWVQLDGIDPARGVFQLSLEVPFNLRIDQRTVIETQVLDYVRRELRQELDRVDQACRDAGLKRTPQKRARKKGDTERHFRWLAEYQILGEDKSTIARSANVAGQTVDEAIKRTSELIGLTLRPSDPVGRPLGRR